MRPPALILAGGLATRMGGGDKPLLMLRGQPLLRHVIDRLAPQAGLLALSANGDPERFAAFALPVLADAVLDREGRQIGPLAGILAGLAWIAPQTPYLLSVAGDTPFLPLDLAARLLTAAAPERPALACSGGRQHPTAALWPLALADDLRAYVQGGERRLMPWFARHSAAPVEWPTLPVDPFLNINRPEDLRDAERSPWHWGATPPPAPNPPAAPSATPATPPDDGPR